MKFIINKAALLSPLQHITGVVEKKQTLPILSNTLLKGDASVLSLTATDLEIQIIAEAPIEEIEGTFKTTVPARKFFDICRLLPETAVIEVEVEESAFKLRSGSSRFRLATLPAETYPQFSSGDYIAEFSVASSQLKRALDKTIFCMAQQDVRFYLNGLMIESTNQFLRFVSSDGHRLAFCELPADISPGNLPQIIIPRKGILELQRLLADNDQSVTVSVGANTVRLQTGRIDFHAKLIDGKFPDYQKVMASSTDLTLSIDKEKLKNALLRVSILANDKLNGIALHFGNDSLSLSSHNTEQEKAEEELEITYNGQPFSMGFNAAYLIDAVSHIDSDSVTLSFTEKRNSCLIEDYENQQFKFIVMPMRL